MQTSKGREECININHNKVERQIEEMERIPTITVFSPKRVLILVNLKSHSYVLVWFAISNIDWVV